MAAMTGDAGQGWSRWRLVPWIAAAALLTMPALAMQFAPGAGVDWSLADFVVMGSMLAVACGAIELAVRASGSTAYRLGALIGVGTGFLTLWANLAVGLVGDEGNPANWLFVGVAGVAAAGAFSARGRAAGMARAMVAAAVAQLVAAAGALAATPPAPGRPAEIVALMGIFPAGWLLAAWLFRRGAQKGA
jgi:hypothetical protein